jgi:hypothetical protein
MKMEIANYCQANNIFPVDMQAFSLIEKFCACPAAGSVLGDIGNTASIFVQTGDFPHHRMAYDMNGGSEVDIQIPAKNLKTSEALSNLVFEIFNAKGLQNFQNLMQRAGKGDMNIDEYSREFEIQEFISKQGYDRLIRECKPSFKIKPKPGTPDLETQLWNHEINCHTDKIRSRWIDMFQKIYCEKHPNDLNSCNAKKQDLCDFYELHNLPEIDQKIIHTLRICKKLPEAPQKIKDSYDDSEDLCRRVLKDEL